ncbi:MAG: SAV_915 family protein [Actinomycetales bacterium]
MPADLPTAPAPVEQPDVSRADLPADVVLLPVQSLPAAGHPLDVLLAELWDGRRVAVGFTSPAAVAACLGDDAAWAAWPRRLVPTLLATIGVTALLLDQGGADGALLEVQR